MYADIIKENGEPLDSFVGVIDVTKIEMRRPSSSN